MTKATQIMSRLWQFQQEGLYCDVILKSTNNTEVPVHACIIAAVCPQMHAEMREHLGSGVEMPLSDEELTEFVAVIYCSKVVDKEADMSPDFRSLIDLMNGCSYVGTDGGTDAKTPFAIVGDLVSKSNDGSRPCSASTVSSSTTQTFKATPPSPSVCKSEPDRQEQCGLGSAEHVSNQSGLQETDKIKTEQSLTDNDSDDTGDSDEVGGTDTPVCSNDKQETEDDSVNVELSSDADQVGNPTKKTSRRKSLPLTKSTGTPKTMLQAKRLIPSSKTTSTDVKQPPKPKRSPRSTVCSYCGKQFKKNWHRVRHERVHSGEKPFKCNYCDQTFSRAAHQKRHENLHTGEIVYICRHCGKEFRHQSFLQYHERTHTAEQNSFQCQYCDKSFNWKQSLEAHERAHRGEYLYQCSICNKNVSTAAVLRDHEKAHRGEKNFQCSFCPARFVRHYGLVVHERIHTGEKPFSCQICNKLFRTQSARGEHERIHATSVASGEIQLPGGRTIKPKTKKEKKEACSYCGKRFLKNCQRVVHERSHTGERPFPCSFCTKSFATLSHKKRHEKLHSDSNTDEIKALPASGNGTSSQYLAENVQESQDPVAYAAFLITLG